MDVLEMDAASRTGVENMRELLDGVRYAPVSARYKVYIIDEVHMLSTGAFNALLKTLEEPPDHAKFIFATTEIRKVPITVLSRCQRFDLRRVEANVLKSHLSGICTRENVTVSDAGLDMIARAAEGSVRDGLSLLDQAIVQSGLDGSEVTGEQVRAMLGLADRTRILDLFAMAAKGDGAGALREMKAQYDDGADPAIIMRDLLDICHEVSRAQTLGADCEFDAAPDQAKRLRELGQELTLGQLTRIWQILLASYSDVRVAPAPLAAAEMALLKVCVAGEMPPPELAAKILSEIQSGNFTPPVITASAGQPTPPSQSSVQTVPVASGTAPAAPSAQTQVKTQAELSPGPTSFLHIDSLEALVKNLPKQEVNLKYDIEKYVRLIRFRQGSITIANLDGAPATLVGKMVEALREMTGELWLINQEAGSGDMTLSERRKKQIADRDERDLAHPAFKHPLLQSAKLIEIRDVPTPDQPDNIIPGDFRPTEVDEDD
jgi:DNA polymerase-3 subunit gamma/tau